jgi:hypothetical protein
MKKWLWSLAIGLLAPVVASAANIALPPQALGASLQELAKQSGIQIIFFSRVVVGHQAPALNGTFTPEAALDELLAGTNLTYHALNARTIEVAPRPPVAAVPWTPLPQPKAEADSDGPLAEVEITAERSTLSAMSAEIVRLENEFYARYNLANTRHQYDVVYCHSLSFTGSHVDRRLCKAASLAAGSLTRVPWMSYQLPLFTNDVPVSIQAPTDPEELRAYQQNMVEVVRDHPELLDLVKQRNELAERYRAARKRRVEVHPVPGQ